MQFFMFSPVETEIYTDMDCGSAVARGANIYAPGLIGSSKKFTAGEKVAAYAVGKMLKGWRQKYDGSKVFLGNGTVLKSRDELFAPPMEKMRYLTGMIHMVAFITPSYMTDYYCILIKTECVRTRPKVLNSFE